jgi:hypothetical protein
LRGEKETLAKLTMPPAGSGATPENEMPAEPTRLQRCRAALSPSTLRCRVLECSLAEEEPASSPESEAGEKKRTG